MNKHKLAWVCLSSALIMVAACSGKKNIEDESDKGVTTVLPMSKNEVKVEILKRKAFNHELVSNGKISARGKADLRFETGRSYLCEEWRPGKEREETG
mgnify:CR=1 FL=1